LTDQKPRPKGDFLITYHPNHPNLFLATGGSGHGYKFFPVLGDKIVDALEGNLEPELQQLWQWPAERLSKSFQTNDGSRSGHKGMILAEELARTKLPEAQKQRL
jgi:sarcosine oxidase/L-pipecolate oxidase